MRSGPAETLVEAARLVHGARATSHGFSMNVAGHCATTLANNVMHGLTDLRDTPRPSDEQDRIGDAYAVNDARLVEIKNSTTHTICSG